MTPGQFILCLDEKKGTAFLVPGFMTHATYVVNNCFYNNNQDYEVAELTHHGFTHSYLFTICKESDRILICDCVDWDLAHKQRMIAAVPQFYKTSYDVGFRFGISTLYCSELVWFLDLIATHPEISIEQLAESKLLPKLKADLSDLEGLGQQYISPDGLLFAKNTRIIWDSDGAMTGFMGPDAEVYCRTKGYIK